HIRLVAIGAAALQLDEIVVAVLLFPLCSPRQRLVITTGFKHLTDIAVAAARKNDQALVLGEPFATDFRTTAVLIVEPGARQEIAQRKIARMVTRQQQNPLRLVAIGLVLEPDIGAGNRLDAFALRCAIELDEAKQVAKVGQRERRLTELDGLAHQGGNLGDAVHHRELGVDAQVYKCGRCGFLIHGRHCTRVLPQPTPAKGPPTLSAASLPTPSAGASRKPARECAAPGRTAPRAALPASS